MENYQNTPNDRDPHLWMIATKRSKFKKSFSVYIIINLFLWIIWYTTTSDRSFSGNNVPWPIWSTIGWGLGMAFQYVDAYRTGTTDSVENEYNKLNNQNQNK